MSITQCCQGLQSVVVEELNYFNQKYSKLTHSPYLYHNPCSLSSSITPFFFSNSLILSSLRLILPLIVLGSSSTNSISLGYLYRAATCLTYCWISRLVRNYLFCRAPIITWCLGRSPVLPASFAGMWRAPSLLSNNWVCPGVPCRRLICSWG